jgi:hypothetical protein
VILASPPHTDTPEAILARNAAAIAKVAALLSVNAEKGDIAAHDVAARAPAEPDLVHAILADAGPASFEPDDPDAAASRANAWHPASVLFTPRSVPNSATAAGGIAKQGFLRRCKPMHANHADRFSADGGALIDGGFAVCTNADVAIPTRCTDVAPGRASFSITHLFCCQTQALGD